MLSDKNVEPTAVAPTHVPNKIVTMYKIPFPAACTKFGTTPDSLISYLALTYQLMEHMKG